MGEFVVNERDDRHLEDLDFRSVRYRQFDRKAQEKINENTASSDIAATSLS
jgi:hypothetical protein